jgi:hypothetical protein
MGDQVEEDATLSLSESQPQRLPEKQSAISINIAAIEKWLEENKDDANYEVVFNKLQEFKSNIDQDSSETNKASLNDVVVKLIQEYNLTDTIAYDGGRGRRRKYSRRGRRSAKKRGTQRKQKRRQRRGSRRAY